MKVTLGYTYKDKITGYEGVATATTLYLSGCTHVSLERGNPKEDNKPQTEWFDEERLEQASAEPIVDSGPVRSPGTPPPAWH